MKRWWPVLSLLVILTMLLGACAVPAAPAAPQVVKETVVVEVEKEVKVVETDRRKSSKRGRGRARVTPAPEQLSGTFIVGAAVIRSSSTLAPRPTANPGVSFRKSTAAHPPGRLSTKPIPWLAERWETEDRPEPSTCARRPFHNGLANAEVVAWNIDRWRTPTAVSLRRVQYYDSGSAFESGIESVEVVDKYTVKIS